MNNYDFLKYLTVYMEGYKKAEAENVLQRVTATGFFATFHIDGKKTNVILTAKHFAEKIEQVTLMLHYLKDKEIVTVPVSSKAKWVFCDNADIAYCELEPFEKRFKSITGKCIYTTFITEDDILKQYELGDMSLLDEIVVAGYPSGEASTHHKYPIFKKGYLASLPADCIEDTEGYIDLSVAGGYSGSPVLLNTTPQKFLGVLVSGVADDSSECSCVSMYVPGYKVLEFIKKK